MRDADDPSLRAMFDAITTTLKQKKKKKRKERKKRKKGEKLDRSRKK